MMPEVNTKPVMPAGALINPQAYTLSNQGPMAEQVGLGNILGQLPANPSYNTSKQSVEDCGYKYGK